GPLPVQALAKAFPQAADSGRPLGSDGRCRRTGEGVARGRCESRHDQAERHAAGTARLAAGAGGKRTASLGENRKRARPAATGGTRVALTVEAAMKLEVTKPCSPFPRPQVRPGRR